MITYLHKWTLSMKLRYKILNGILAILILLIGSVGIAIGYTADCEPAASSSAQKNSMNAVIYRCYGSPEVLEYVAVAKPTPIDDEVLVKIHAAGVNPLDWHYMRGAPYLMRLMSGIGEPKRQTMGVDFSGVVEAVGKNVSKFKVGDSVFGGRGGAFGEYVTIPESRALALKPNNMTHEQAAAVPIAATTALQALRDMGKLQAGQKVLINGASGGVGTYAVQIAKYYGADVTAVNSTRNVDMVLSIGADRVIDYKKDDYTTQNIKYDLIVDMVGNHSLSKNIDVLKPSGRLVNVGSSEKGNWIAPLITPVKALFMNPFIDQEIVGFVASMNQDDINVLAQMMQAGKLTSVLDNKRFQLSETAKAIAYSETGRARGKIIVTVE
jgi:NADPH:quinone reductase-like Zn-dependent oxidoreductase